MRCRASLPTLVGASFLLYACGNGEGDGPLATPAQVPDQDAPSRGALLGTPVRVIGLSAEEILARVQNDPASRLLLPLALAPDCSIDVYHMEYQAAGARGEPATASAALMVPTGGGGGCTGPRPLLLYAHGTATLQSFDISDLTTPDNVEGLLIAAILAGDGYIVVAPNYAGYDTSSLPYHAYLHAEQQSGDMVDALAAAREALPGLSAPVVASDRLFVTGYSQGGYVAMATHRALEAAGVAVTASGPMSGPYALSAFGDAIFSGQVPTNAPANLTLLITGYQQAYGNLYNDPREVFEIRYASGIDTLLPATIPLEELERQGRLPARELFSTVPPAPELADITPPAAPEELAGIFARGFGPANLLTNAFRLSYLQDVQIAPDGFFPGLLDALPPMAPAHPLRLALKDNDLRNWAPRAPVMLCGGSADPTVFFFNTRAMEAFWQLNPPAVPISVLDVDSDELPDDPHAGIKAAFAAAVDLVRAEAIAGGATDGGEQAALEAYHAGLVPPFCLSAVKAFFDAS